MLEINTGKDRKKEENLQDKQIKYLPAAHFKYLNSLTCLSPGEKPFTCSNCDKCFAQKCQLVAHRRMHHGEEKPYTCERCGFKFATSSNYKIHIRFSSCCVKLTELQRKWLNVHFFNVFFPADSTAERNRMSATSAARRSLSLVP